MTGSLPHLSPNCLRLPNTPVSCFGSGQTVGTQFHPEVDQNHVTAWLSACDDDYLSEHGVNRETILADMIAHEERNTAQCHAFVDWFLDRVAFPTAQKKR